MKSQKKHTALGKKSSKSKGSLTKPTVNRLPSIRSPRLLYVVCVDNGGYADLELFKVYRVKSDRQARDEGMLRVIDLSGEDYLYPQSFFQPIHASRRLFEIVDQKAGR